MQTSSLSSNPLDGVTLIRNYVDRIVHGNGKCQGMKVLLLDAATTQIVSAVYSQTEILNQQVYLVTALDKIASENSEPYENSRGSNSRSNPNGHLKAVCFLRPTQANVDALAMELQHTHYSEYHLFFSGKLDSGLLRKLAEADAASEKVVQVHEMYADFLPANGDLWTLQCRHTLAMTTSAGTSWAPQHAVQYERHVMGVCSMLLAMKRRPMCIRYAAHSPCAEELARDVHDAIVADELYHFRRPVVTANSGIKTAGNLLLLILDRRDDPITPLLSQWTYQAMVHELLGLNNHRVVLRGAPGIAKDLEEVVLSSEDDFYGANKHSNFGELGEAIQKLLRDYQKQTAMHSTENLNTVADMQQFMDKFPELRSRSHVVSKHVAIMGELARLVQVCSLMDVSQLEQTLACQDDHSLHWRELLERLGSPTVKIPDKLRLGLLYALRYESSANMHMLQQAMAKGGVPPDMVSLVATLLRYGGSLQRSPGLFADSHNIMSRMTKNIVGAVAGVDNVYSQHVPLLTDTLQSVVRGKLSSRDYPIVAGSTATAATTGVGSSGSPQHSSNPIHYETMIPDEILVFVVGGVTYEEGTKVAEFNASHKGRVQVILAGSTVHNSTSFLDELRATSI
jgi:vacuolar protein sorting-associated protein 45